MFHYYSSSIRATKEVSAKEKNLPQLQDGFMQITPGYDNLCLKSPLCWEQLSHTKNNNIVTLGKWVMYLTDSANI